MATPATVLIVEDEVLIADTITIHLELNGYKVIGSAISYEEAVTCYRNFTPDVVLIDIRLSGQKTGIDFACFLRKQPAPPPFIYLTSQLDTHFLSLAKQTRPAGYLSKPLQVSSLITTIAVALFNATDKDTGKMITVKNGGSTHRINSSDILYVRAEHVYVSIKLADGQILLDRSTLTDFLEQLDNPDFIQTHRSYVVNLTQVTGFDAKEVFVGPIHIPMSRGRRQEILDRLKVINKKK